ncbi:DUF885 domain-containing protein [Gluconobacter wancherniae]|uniref:DUF885 domain-containing protein n=1 Tax=Gluconobacter wancherniae TaxID=1307955 RepID=UPI0030B1B438
MKHILVLATLLSAGTVSGGPASAASLAEIARAHYHAEWAADPVDATMEGVHDGDARLNDVSEQFIATQTLRLHAEQEELQALDMSGASLQEKDDRDILLASLKGELLLNEVIKPYRHDPDHYIYLVTNSLYGLIARNYATPEARMKAAIARLRQFPAFLSAAPKQLDHVPAVFIEVADEDLLGALGFIGNDVPTAFSDVHNPQLQSELANAGRDAVAALQHFRSFLLQLKPDGNFVLGREAMKTLLAADMVDAPPETIISLGEQNLEKDRADFLQVAAQIDPKHPMSALQEIRQDHPSLQNLIPTALSQLKELQDFVIAHHLVTLPSLVLPEVVATPPFEQALISAATEWPGPFEKTFLPSFYDITPPSPALTPLQAEEALEDFNRPALLNTTIHEVMPGHFVQGLYLYAHPEWSLIRRGANSYTTTEGWAHYGEQMMVEQGADDHSPALHLMQLQDAVLRDCRLLVSFGMHMQGMSLLQATQMMETRCFQSPAAAYREARRGTVDPGYFSYTLGKLMILKLRKDLQQKQGNSFSLQKFHDAIMGSGLVPLRAIRREMTGQDGDLL